MGMAAETKEKDFVHRIDTMIKSIIPNAEIAGIINIVPWEGNTHGFEKSKLDYIQDIDFDCVVFRVGENVKEWMILTHRLLICLIITYYLVK